MRLYRLKKFINFTLLIIKLEMILRELLGLANLTKTWVFYIFKLSKAIIIDWYKNFILAVSNF